jgi:hypothetical protein
MGLLEGDMQAQAFWRTVTGDESGFLPEFLAFLEAEGVRYAVIGGQAVNAYADPLVSLDLDLVVDFGRMEQMEAKLRQRFDVKSFEHSLNVSRTGSDLRIQIQTDPRYASFVERASSRDVLGFALQVADLPDVLQGKVWAASDEKRRPSKRQKDLADIARLLDRHPELRPRVPEDILKRLI